MDRFLMAYTVLGGLGIFVLGMKFLSESLQAIASDFIRKVINWLTTNRILAVLVGTVVTMIVQSSSITTVMVVGMVNAGLMNLTQAIGVIFGANIGTTITGWIIAIKIGKYGLLMIALGIFPMFFTKNDNWKAAGKLLVALGLVFYGLKIMGGGFKPLRTDADFLSLLHYFTANSYLSVIGCIAIGCLTTCIVQSSSAMLGITIAMASTGVISFQTAMALVLGENIGTTITALLASIGANTQAKRAARAHAFFNVFGVSVMLLIFWNYVHFIDWLIPHDPNFIDATGSKPHIAEHIAMGHTFFNVTASIIFLPFLGYLAKFVTWVTPEKKTERNQLLSLYSTTTVPALALEQAEKDVERMMNELKVLLDKTHQYTLLEKDDPKLMDDIMAREELFDHEQKELTVFTCNLMEAPLTPEQSSLGYALIRASDEIESVSDYCAALAKVRKKMLKHTDRQIDEDSKKDLDTLFNDVFAFFEEVRSYTTKMPEINLKDFEIKTHQLEKHVSRVRKAYFRRMDNGKSNPFAALTFSDLLRNISKIRSHTSNIVEAFASVQEV